MGSASRVTGNCLDRFRADDSCKRVSAPAGVIFMPRYVRIDRCARSLTRRVGFANTIFFGVGATLLRGHANLEMALSVKGSRRNGKKRKVTYVESVQRR